MLLLLRSAAVAVAKVEEMRVGRVIACSDALRDLMRYLAGRRAVDLIGYHGIQFQRKQDGGKTVAEALEQWLVPARRLQRHAARLLQREKVASERGEVDVELLNLAHDLRQIRARNILQVVVLKRVREEEVVVVELGVCELLPQRPDVVEARPNDYNSVKAPEALGTRGIQPIDVVHLQLQRTRLAAHEAHSRRGRTVEQHDLHPVHAA